MSWTLFASFMHIFLLTAAAVNLTVYTSWSFGLPGKLGGWIYDNISCFYQKQLPETVGNEQASCNFIK